MQGNLTILEGNFDSVLGKRAFFPAVLIIKVSESSEMILLCIVD